MDKIGMSTGTWNVDPYVDQLAFVGQMVHHSTTNLILIFYTKKNVLISGYSGKSNKFSDQKSIR